MTPRPGVHRVVILTITVVCGLAGGLLASLIWHIDSGALLLALFISSAIATVVAFSLLTGEREVRSPARPGPRDASPASWPSAPARSAPAFNRTGSVGPVADSSTQPRSDAPGRVVLPLADRSPEPGSGKRQWWTEASPNSSGKSANSPAPAPSLEDYQAHRALIAQCPHCGDFRIDVSSAGPNYSFRCRNSHCGNTWTWTPGSPWPAVVVRRNLPGSAPERAK
jgi:hypothetical protein